MEGGSPSPKATAGAEADVPKASPEGRPQVPAKPRVPGRPQELASPPASRPTPAPRKASESTAPTPPTPRPRSSLQQENLVEQGGGSSLVNGERGSRWGWGLPGVCLAFKRTCAGSIRGARCLCLCVVDMLGTAVALRLLIHAASCYRGPSVHALFSVLGGWDVSGTLYPHSGDLPPRPACVFVYIWVSGRDCSGAGGSCVPGQVYPGVLPSLNNCPAVEISASPPHAIKSSHVTSLGFLSL